jgi:two-component system response regulator YesN
VATAPDGRTALERMAASLPDLLITDLLMPGLTGWSLFARVRRRTPTLPIIIMSGTDMGSRQRQGSRQDRTVFLRKPLDLDQLLAAVTRLLSTQEDEDSPRGGR